MLVMDPIPTSMDLRSISCKGIKSFNLFLKPSVYAVVSVADPSNPGGKQKRQKTAADPDGGENPEWAESFRFDLDGVRGDLALALRFDVMVQGNLLLLLPDRTVGKVNVPITDLLAEGSDGSVRHVSYRVVGTDCRPNGVITFSYNFNFPPVSLPPGGCCPPPPCKLDPAIPSRSGNCYPRAKGIPLPPGHYYPPPHQQSTAMPSPAADYYPPPNQQYGTTISSPADDYYPPPHQQYPVASSPASEYYPPPRQQEPVTEFPAADCCPLPRQHYQMAPASDYYPPPRQQEPVLALPAADYCPKQCQQDRAVHPTAPAANYYYRPRQLHPTVLMPASDYYSAARQHEPVVCYSPPGTEIAYYAPPPSSPLLVAYPPPSAPPQPAYCYPAPGKHDGYWQENWDRRLY